jgi:hypothetical protein
MHSCRFLTGFAIWIALSATAPAATAQYTKAMFTDGLSKGGFVLITLRDPTTGSEPRLCVLENMLLGAIHMQYHIGFGETGRNRAERFALRHWNQPFVFTNRKAFSNVKAEYKPTQLAEIRKRLSKYGRSALSKQLSDPYGSIHDLYTHPYRESYRDAVAHILLDNRILVGVDDRTPMLLPLE